MLRQVCAQRGKPMQSDPPRKPLSDSVILVRPAMRVLALLLGLPVALAAAAATTGDEAKRGAQVSGVIAAMHSDADVSIKPRLTLDTTLPDRSARPTLPDSVISALRQKQQRLKAMPAVEDIPSLEAELAALQKQISESRGQTNSPAPMVRDSRGSPTASVGINGAPALQQVPGLAAGTGALPGAMPNDSSTRLWGRLDQRQLLALSLGVVLTVLLVAFVFWVRRERSNSRLAGRWNKPVPEPLADRPEPKVSFGAGSSDAIMSEIATAPAESPLMPEIAPSPPPASGQPTRETNVSDLAQATEKAGVFVALGRPEQAIEVLRDHIDHEPKPSGMAWLMLLDLYRQADRLSDFADVSQRFHLEYNAETPKWDHIRPLHDTGLAAFPHLIRKIRDDWATPECRNFIEDLLYDNQGGSRIGFSLPAFHDLLLLHGIIEDYLRAREVAARTGRRSATPLPHPPPPPPHLAAVWATATALRPEFPIRSSSEPNTGPQSSSGIRAEIDAIDPTLPKLPL